MEPRSPEQILAETPSSVWNASSLIMLSGLLLVINAVGFGIRSGRWVGLVQAVGLVFAASWIGGALLTKEPWSWWVAVVGGSLLFLRSFIGLPAWLISRREGRAVDIHIPFVYASAPVVSAVVVVLLTRRDSRACSERIRGGA